MSTPRLPRHATKIVATLCPASNTLELLEQMILNKVSVVRLNFSHGTAQDHIDRANLVREVSRAAGKEVAIMADLQGPKIRVGKFEGGKIMLEPGQKFVLDAGWTGLGTPERGGLDYKELPRDVKPGDTLAAIAKYGIEDKIGYISTGGGAFLEVLEGKTLPAFEILQRRALG